MVASAEGLDVSNFQRRFNWAGTKGLSFGAYRLTQGLGGPGVNSPDPDSTWNHRAIADKGLNRQAYHFLDPRLSGPDQAKYFVDQADKLGVLPHDVFWLDNETAAGMSPGKVSECAVGFMGELHTLIPHNPQGVYTFIDFAKEGYNAGLSHEPLWLAYPSATAPSAPPPWTRWTFWQWGQRNGVDADAFNGTVQNLDDWLNSFGVGHPHRHIADGTKSLAAIAQLRNTTVEHLLEVSFQKLDTENWHKMVVYILGTGGINAAMPVGLVYWTSN